MKKWALLSLITLIGLLLGTAQVEAADQMTPTSGPPAILASLGVDTAVTTLDDTTAAGIRGTAPKYVMSSLQVAQLGIFPRGNPFSDDTFVEGGKVSGKASWSKDPYLWRYGNWGGYGWTDGKESPTSYCRCGSVVDTMDTYFRTHDNAYTDAKGASAKIRAADQSLLSNLQALPNARTPYWGSVYVSSPQGAPTDVRVLTGTGLRNIPFSEYARRQAVTGFQVQVILHR